MVRLDGSPAAALDPRAERAVAAWQSYQQAHDVSAHADDAVAVDAGTGRVWFGSSVSDVMNRAKKLGVGDSLYVLRIGKGDELFRSSRTVGRWRKAT